VGAVVRGRMLWSRPAAIALAVAALVWSADAAAQCSAGRSTWNPSVKNLTTSDYALDLHQGPVFAGTRVIGLAGAFVAIAEGVDGDTQNPASPAVRAPYSYSSAEQEFGFGVTFPSGLQHYDFFNSGRETCLPTANQVYVFLNGAVHVQVDNWGFAATGDLQQYTFRGQNAEPDAGRRSLTAQIMQNHVMTAHAFDDGQLAIGVGARVTTLTITTRSSLLEEGTNLLQTNGAGVEVGFVFRPNDTRVRLGGAFRSSSTAKTPFSSRRLLDGNNDDPDDDRYIPSRVTVPWDVNVGAALQLGQRPLNPPWINPRDLVDRLRRRVDFRARERARAAKQRLAAARARGEDTTALAAWLAEEEQNASVRDEEEIETAKQDVKRSIRRAYDVMPRPHVLITTSLVMTGVVEDGVGLEGFLDGKEQRSGKQISLSPRVGLELEPILNWTKIRGGAYFEPTRFPTNTAGGRSHSTFGIDQKILPWEVFGTFPEGNWFRLTGAVDLARNYLGWAVAIGVWH
jgi:hypothetical protein